VSLQSSKVTFPLLGHALAWLAKVPVIIPLVYFLGFISLVQAQRTRDLVNESPFFPPTFNLPKPKGSENGPDNPPATPPPPPPQIQQNLEFKGCFRLGNVWRFSILDKRTSKSNWVRLNEKADAGFTILEYDAENQSVTIEENGHKETLSIESPSGAVVPVSHLANAAKPAPPAAKPAQSQTPPTPPQNIPRRRIVTPRPN
jgi:hypothetical protein